MSWWCFGLRSDRSRLSIFTTALYKENCLKELFYIVLLFRLISRSETSNSPNDSSQQTSPYRYPGEGIYRVLFPLPVTISTTPPSIRRRSLSEAAASSGVELRCHDDAFTGLRLLARSVSPCALRPFLAAMTLLLINLNIHIESYVAKV